MKTTRTKTGNAEAASGFTVDAFKPGDLVTLKSGGPKMTVKSTGMAGFQDDDYYCQWFAGANLKSGHFKFDSLKRVENVVDSLDIEPR
jgi:uncharacterized protein YodC (DUF2158 family)